MGQHPATNTGVPRPIRRFALGFGWLTVAGVGALLAVGSVFVALMSAWVRLGLAASDLEGPETTMDPAKFFAEAFSHAYLGLTIELLMAVCGIVLFLLGAVLGVRRLLRP